MDRRVSANASARSPVLASSLPPPVATPSANLRKRGSGLSRGARTFTRSWGGGEREVQVADREHEHACRGGSHSHIVRSTATDRAREGCDTSAVGFRSGCDVVRNSCDVDRDQSCFGTVTFRVSASALKPQSTRPNRWLGSLARASRRTPCAGRSCSLPTVTCVRHSSMHGRSPLPWCRSGRTAEIAGRSWRVASAGSLSRAYSLAGTRPGTGPAG